MFGASILLIVNNQNVMIIGYVGPLWKTNHPVFREHEHQCTESLKQKQYSCGLSETYFWNYKTHEWDWNNWGVLRNWGWLQGEKEELIMCSFHVMSLDSGVYSESKWQTSPCPCCVVSPCVPSFKANPFCFPNRKSEATLSRSRNTGVWRLLYRFC